MGLLGTKAQTIYNQPMFRTQRHALLKDPANQCPPVKENPLRPCTKPKNRTTASLARCISRHQVASLFNKPCNQLVSSWTHSSFHPLLLQFLLRHWLLFPGRKIFLGILVQKEVANAKNQQGSHHHNEHNESRVKACALLDTSLLQTQTTY